MRIIELLGIKKYHDHTINDLIDLLNSSNVEISNGKFAKTIITKTHVYKIWNDDPGYDVYLDKVIMPLQGNVFIPEVLKRKQILPKFFDFSGDMYVLRLEILYEPHNIESRKLFLKMVQWGFNRNYSLFSLPEKFKKEYSDSDIKYFQIIVNNFKEAGTYEDFEEWYNKIISLSDEYHFDTNPRNIMFRDDQMVFIDMLYDERSFESSGT